MREDNYYSGKTYIWTYDKGGNILTKSEYAYTAGTLGEPLNTVNYSYGNSDWKDLLTEYNGTAISYDLSGNPLNWRNASSLTWDGRRLAGMTLTDGTELAFEYNSAGIRIGKTVGTDKTVEYLLDGTKIIREIRKVNGTVTETLLYYYNTDGDVIGLNYNGTDYYYGRNMQGDILYIYNTSGEIVTTYAYDAWGSIVSQTGTLSSTVGEANPFRYRGYYLDSETGLYYLQSRYYDPTVGRFLNADESNVLEKNRPSLINNLFMYCNNCSTMFFDPYGEDAILLLYAKSAKKLGHLSVMVQDKSGNWFYFYWGANNTSSRATLFGGYVKSYYKFDYLYAKGSRPWVGYFSNIKTFLMNRDLFNPSNIKYSNGLTHALYIKGDFSLSCTYYSVSKNFRYQLFVYNCAQAVLLGLSFGFASFDPVRFNMILRKTYKMKIPNLIFMTFAVAYGGVIYPK